MAIPIDGAAIVLSPPSASVATGASHTLSFDKTGFDYANIYLICGTHSTNAGNMEVMAIVEHSSVTSATSMTAIPAFTGGTLVSTSVGFVIPDDANTGEGTVIEFQVDLRKRKKKIALMARNSVASMTFASIAILTRGHESADTAAKKSALTLHSLTSATSVAAVVTG